MSISGTIRNIEVATIRAPLPETIRFGAWVMREREFVLVRVRSADGMAGFAFSLTRDGPIAAAIRQSVVAHYLNESFNDPASLFHRAQGANLPTLSNGLGLRALSLVDLATWDLKARAEGVSITRLLGGVPSRLPATAIIGYPPSSMDADGVRTQVRMLRDAGWRRFKIAVVLPLEHGRDRILAARDAAGDDAWLGADGAWIFRDPAEVAAFLRSVSEAKLAWFEDALQPGDASVVAELRSKVDVPIAMGDEQGGSYYPEALLMRNAVDVVRLDVTCMGGLTCVRDLVARCDQARVLCAPHMYAHVHSQAFAGLRKEVPIEWGVPGTGVDQFADSLIQPIVIDGLMEPLPEEPGFGSLVNTRWLADQSLDDPDGLVRSLEGANAR